MRKGRMKLWDVTSEEENEAEAIIKGEGKEGAKGTKEESENMMER